MVLSLGPTLAELRRDVAIEVNWGAEVESNVAAHPIIDRQIRKAYHRIVLDFSWAVLEQRHEQDLIHQQISYDIPDGLYPGKISRVVVVDNEGKETELIAGISPRERTDWRPDRVDGLPLRYEIIDGRMDILPAPRVTQENNEPVYVTLRIEGQFTPLPPQKNEDRVPVDGEALIGLASAFLLAKLRSPDAGVALQAAEIYLSRLQPTQSTNESFRVGGSVSNKHPYVLDRGAASGRRTGQNGWWDGWTPDL